MKTELATVVRILDADMAEVEIRVAPASDHACCGACSASPSSVRVRARNGIGAAVGQTVRMENKTGAALTAVLLVLIAPILFAAVGYSFWKPWGAAAGIGGLLLSLWINHLTAASRTARILSIANHL